MRTLTLQERWKLQRDKEVALQNEVNLRAFAPDADPIEQMYTNVAILHCYGTEAEQYASLDAVGIPREVGPTKLLSLQERAKWLDRNGVPK